MGVGGSWLETPQRGAVRVGSCVYGELRGRVLVFSQGVLLPPFPHFYTPLPGCPCQLRAPEQGGQEVGVAGVCSGSQHMSSNHAECPGERWKPSHAPEGMAVGDSEPLSPWGQLVGEAWPLPLALWASEALSRGPEGVAECWAGEGGWKAHWRPPTSGRHPRTGAQPWGSTAPRDSDPRRTFL